jgi:hypothetical protein
LKTPSKTELLPNSKYLLLDNRYLIVLLLMSVRMVVLDGRLLNYWVKVVQT